jgi:hypothetical protein
MSDTGEDRSELVDDEVIDGEYPPERPLGAGERRTAREEQMGDSLQRQRAREEPDRLPNGGADDDRVGPLVDGADELGVDDEDQEVALELRDDDDEPDGGSILDLGEVQPAEEAAMHLTEPPPLHDDDGYLGSDRGSVHDDEDDPEGFGP